MSYDVDAFLAHHGVKGQKWGFRNQVKKAGTAVITEAHRARKFVKAHPKATAAAVGASAAVGAAAAAALLAKHGHKPPPGMTHDFSPEHVLNAPISDALKKEMFNWKVVS